MVELFAPFFGEQRHIFTSVVSLYPNATHFGDHLTIAIGSNTTTGTIPKGFWAGHWTSHAGRMQNTLPTHLTIPDRLFYSMLHNRQ